MNIKAILLASTFLLGGTILNQGRALAQSDSPYPYCQLLEIPAADSPAAQPSPILSSPESAALEAGKPPKIVDLLKQTTDAADIVNRILSVAAPAKPEELEKIYDQVYSDIISTYIEPSRIKGLSVYENKYKGQLTTWAQLDAAISDVIGAVGDRWTWYNGPVALVKAEIESKEKLVDFGAHLRLQKDGTFVVEFITPGSTAQLAGIREGDTILSINGKTLAGISKDDAEKLGRQAKGDQLDVVSIQDGQKVEATYTLLPPADDANAGNVEVIYNNIAYLKLPSFMSEPLFEKLVDKLVESEQKTPGGFQGMVLDLRYNGGGLVDMAKSLIRLLMQDGVVLHERKREGQTVVDTTTTLIPLPEIMASQRSPEIMEIFKTFQKIPLVVLINGSSASASEIVTGTLKDSRPNTTIMGERSFGKGVEMSIQPLPTCGKVAITSAAYTTPKGTWLHNVGIEPYVIVHQVRGSADDAQLLAAVKQLHDQTANNGANVAVAAPGDQTILGQLPERPSEPQVSTWKRQLENHRRDITRGAAALLLLLAPLCYLIITRRRKG